MFSNAYTLFVQEQYLFYVIIYFDNNVFVVDYRFEIIGKSLLSTEK